MEDSHMASHLQHQALVNIHLIPPFIRIYITVLTSNHSKSPPASFKGKYAYQIRIPRLQSNIHHFPKCGSFIKVIDLTRLSYIGTTYCNRKS